MNLTITKDKSVSPYQKTLSILSALLIYFCFSSVSASANDASVLCIYEFDGVISVTEKNCEDKIMTDDAYAKRKRGYLYSNHPECDLNSDGAIHGDDEDKCVMKIKLVEYEKLNEEKKHKYKLFPICDTDGNGSINGKENRCVINTELLIKAVDDGDVTSFKKYVADGAKIEQKNSEGETLLRQVLCKDSKDTIQIIEALIEAGANINNTNDKGNTALMLAANNGNVKAVDILLKNGADPNIKKEEYTALKYAIFNGKTLAAKKLIESGSVRTENELLWVTRLKPINKELLNMLIDQKDDVNQLNIEDKQTPLLAAVGNVDDEISRVICEIQNTLGRKIEMSKDKIEHFSKYNHDDLEAVVSLIRAGANINAKNSNGETPIIVSAQTNSDSGIIQQLILSGSNVDDQDNEGKTALHHVASNQFMGSLDIVRVLVKSKANVNIPDKLGKTPLHYMAQNLNDQNAVNKIRILLENGAKANIRDKSGNTPLHDAGYNTFEVASILIDNGAYIKERGSHGEFIINKFSENDDPRIISLLLKLGEDVNAPSSELKRPLHGAADRVANPEIISILINAGADVNAKTSKEYGSKTPLHYAVSRLDKDDNMSIIEALIKAGANIHAQDFNGDTPLNLAKKEKKSKVIIDALSKYY